MKEVQSMAVTNNDGMYSYLDQLSTQELEDLLQKIWKLPMVVIRIWLCTSWR